MHEEWSPPATLGEYRLERLLGQGGMGSVWLAYDSVLERSVAIKFGRIVSDDARLRTRTEARAIARLSHPNIIKVHHASEIDDRPVIVTEVLTGTSLDRLKLPLPADQVASIGLGIARGLAAAHAAGVLHRDVKPANTFLCTDGAAKLLDFGLAQMGVTRGEVAGREGTQATDDREGAFDSTVAHGLSSGVMGTPLYMAPETWRALPATRHTDVYSLGAVLYELLAARPPHSADTIVALRKAVVSGTPEDLRLLAPDTPGELVSLITACLAKDPNRRPLADQVARALEAIVTPPSPADSEPVAATGNPYRGLLAFGPEHREVFFGRDDETAAVLDAMRSSPLVIVAGDSGVGKSSLVRAGIVPRVQAGSLGPGVWRVAVAHPGPRPVEQLGRALAAALSLDEEKVRAALASGPGAVQSALPQVERGNVRLLIVLDQLEELWTLAGAEAQATTLEAIRGLAAVGPGVRLVATLRADFLEHIVEIPDPRTLHLVRPLSRDGLREAVVGPAAKRGVVVETDLLNALTGAAGAGEQPVSPGALPLLEFALALLWDRNDPERRARRAFTLADLEALGGLEGALASHADVTLAEMTDLCRAEARRLLLSLVTVQRTRARREATELSLEKPGAREALDALVAARLLVASAGDESADYELAHEALIECWPALRAWLNEEAGAREAADRLERGAAEWRRVSGGEDALLGERPLRELRASGALAIASAGAVAFFEASLAATGRRRRRRRALVGSMLLLVALASILSWAVVRERRRSRVEAGLAEARRLSATADAAAHEAAATEARAWDAFGREEVAPAEDLWRQLLREEADLDGRRQEVGAALDRVLALEPSEARARATYADLVVTRLLAAERFGWDELAASLRKRLDEYDDGSRVAALIAPGTVTVDASPAEAVLQLARYRDPGDGHLVEDDLGPVEPGVPFTLPVGSYRLVAQAAGFATTTDPFTIERGQAQELRIDLPRAEDVPLAMIYVPAGRFLYGNAHAPEARNDENHQPIHAVDLHAFLIARREITYGEYLTFVRAMPAEARAGLLPKQLELDRAGIARVNLRDAREWKPESEPDCLSPAHACVAWQTLPVDFLKLPQAILYTRWLAGTGLRGARLCTDQEWERAARGADGRAYSWGDAAPTAQDACSAISYADRLDERGPCPPGTHPRSTSLFGVEDMLGNVSEWVTHYGPDPRLPVPAIFRGGAGWEVASCLFLGKRTASGENIGFGGIRVCADAR